MYLLLTEATSWSLLAQAADVQAVSPDRKISRVDYSAVTCQALLAKVRRVGQLQAAERETKPSPQVIVHQFHSPLCLLHSTTLSKPPYDVTNTGTQENLLPEHR